MAAATANAGIIFTNLLRIRLICHELGYVKILGNVPLILSFGNSNSMLLTYYYRYSSLICHFDFQKPLPPFTALEWNCRPKIRRVGPTGHTPGGNPATPQKLAQEVSDSPHF